MKMFNLLWIKEWNNNPGNRGKRKVLSPEQERLPILRRTKVKLHKQQVKSGNALSRIVVSVGKSKKESCLEQ